MLTAAEEEVADRVKNNGGRYVPVPWVNGIYCIVDLPDGIHSQQK